MSRIRFQIAWAALAVAVTLAAGPTARAQAKAPASPLELARQLNQAFIEVADQVSPAVVVIRVAQKPGALRMELEDNPLWERIPPDLRERLEEYRDRQQRQQQRKPNQDKTPPRRSRPLYTGQGSGIVIREEGYILTNGHVVDEAEKIQVRFKDDANWYDAEVRGADAQSDIAVIKVDAKGKKLKAAKLGDSGKARVGAFAIAIGAPFDLDYSVTFGHVSAIGRSHILNDRTMDQDFIQTDANINPGNSGGPLVNIEGEVIGINTLIQGLHSGIGFAVPINLARVVAEKLITEGKYVRAYLGVAIMALRDDPEMRDSVTNLTDGVVVKEIPRDGPAAKSELKAGDVITAVDGKPVVAPQQLKNEIRDKPIGGTVVLDVCRDGQTIKVKVKPEVWPENRALLAARRNAPVEEDAHSFGLTVRSVTKDLAEKYDVEKKDGVIVTEVEPGSVAALKGLRPGDIITEVAGKPVTTPREFREQVRKADPKKGVRLIYESRGTSVFEFLKESGD